MITAEKARAETRKIRSEKYQGKIDALMAEFEEEVKTAISLGKSQATFAYYGHHRTGMEFTPRDYNEANAWYDLMKVQLSEFGFDIVSATFEGGSFQITIGWL